MPKGNPNPNMSGLRPATPGEARNPGGQSKITAANQRMARTIAACLLMPGGDIRLEKIEAEGWGNLIREVQLVRERAHAGHPVSLKRWESYIMGAESLNMNISDLSRIPAETLVEALALMEEDD